MRNSAVRAVRRGLSCALSCTTPSAAQPATADGAEISDTTIPKGLISGSAHSANDPLGYDSDVFDRLGTCFRRADVRR
jgi:hypothetical protein